MGYVEKVGKRDVVGSLSNISELKDQFDEKRYRYRVEPNEMPEAIYRVRPQHPLKRNLDHNWQQVLQKTSASRSAGRWRCTAISCT